MRRSLGCTGATAVALGVSVLLLRFQEGVAKNGTMHISTTVISDLVYHLGEDAAQDWIDCDLQVLYCRVSELAYDFTWNANVLREDLHLRPRAEHPIVFCNNFFDTAVDRLQSLKAQCTEDEDWPSICDRMEALTLNRMYDPTYDLPFACRLILNEPGEPMPTCNDIAQGMLYSMSTLTACSSMGKAECVQNFCNIMGEFRWRANPRNMQEDTNPYLHTEAFMLEGCADMMSWPYYHEDCPAREDVNGFCDCICGILPLLGNAYYTNCAENADGWFLFGRFQVPDLRLDLFCYDDFCDTLSRYRAHESCEWIGLPTFTECKAYELPYLADEYVPCPWVNSSGQEGIMDCIDGSSCSVIAEGWGCCTMNNRRGRARCPAELPVMCDIVCSGGTEYCCGTYWSCTERPCPAVMNVEPRIIPPSTQPVTTRMPFAPRVEDDTGWNFELPHIPVALLIWLVTLVPCCAFCGIALWWSKKQFDFIPPVSDGKVVIETDALGQFTAVKKDLAYAKEERVRKVAITVDKLPERRPLGLELRELTVVRTHAPGKRMGWQVGDVILSIAGQKVETFEDLWAQIQLQRDRCPVTFIAERRGAEVLHDVADSPAAASRGGLRSAAAGGTFGDTDVRGLIGELDAAVAGAGDEFEPGDSSGDDKVHPFAMQAMDLSRVDGPVTIALPPEPKAPKIETRDPKPNILERPKKVLPYDKGSSAFESSFPEMEAIEAQAANEGRPAPKKFPKPWESSKAEVRWVRDAWGRQTQTVMKS